jgi:hypothetical protein
MQVNISKGLNPWVQVNTVASVSEWMQVNIGKGVSDRLEHGQQSNLLLN